MRALAVAAACCFWVAATGAAHESKKVAQETKPAETPPAAEDPAPPDTPPPGGDLVADAGPVDISDLEDLLNTPVSVTTVNMMVESLREAPAVVAVIGADELQAWGYRDVAEALSHVVGLYVVDDNTVPNLAVRGVTAGLSGEGGFVKLMIDGHPMNFRPTSGAWLGAELLPLTAIKHIGIIKGPASAVHGADAFLGVVNLVTVDPAEGGSSRLHLSGGPAGYLADGTVSISSPAWSLVGSFSGAAEDRSGLKLPHSSPAPLVPTYHDGDLVAHGLDRTSRAAFAKLTWRPDSVVDKVELSFNHSAFEHGGDFAPWAQLNTSANPKQPLGTVIALQQQVVAGRVVSALAPGLQAQWTGEMAWGGNTDADRIETGSTLSYVERDIRYQATTLKLDLAWEPEAAAFSLAGGLEYLHDVEHIGALWRVARDTGELQKVAPNPEHVLGNLGAVVQGTYKLFEDRLKLTAGLRVDRHSLYGTELSGRASAVARLGDNLVLKLLYGSAFKAPSAYLLFSQPFRPGDVIGNPELRPQKVHTVEAIAAYELMRYFSLSTGLSYSRLIDKAEFVPRGVNQEARNIASMQMLAYEAEVAMIVPSGIRGGLGFEMPLGWRDQQQAGYLSQLLDDGLTVYPRYIVRANLMGRIALGESLGLRLGSQVLWAAARPASDNNVFQNGATYELPPYAEVDLLAGLVDLQVFGSRPTSVTARLTNALDEHSVDPGFAGNDIPRPRRTFFVTLEQEL